MQYLSISLIVLGFIANAIESSRIVCYYTNWSVYRPGIGKFDTSNVDTQLCTHFIYAFVGITTSGGIKLKESEASLQNFVALRQKSTSGTKFMVAIGGYGEGPYGFSAVAANSELRKTFVTNAVEFLQKYNLDGLDVDWEYPTQGTTPADKPNLSMWLRELKEEFTKNGMILSAAVNAVGSTASDFYEVAEIVKSLDFINLMTYDMHGSWETKTGEHAAVSRGSWEDTNDDKNIEAVIDFWVSNGGDATILNLGIPFYGKGWTLADANNHKIGAPTVGASQAGLYTREAGTFAYYEICSNLKNGNWKRYFDNEQKTPYAVSNDGQWVGYDDVESIRRKINLIKTRGLGGGMVWSIDFDDFQGNCGEKNPLLTLMNKELTSISETTEISIPPIIEVLMPVKEQTTIKTSTSSSSSTSEPIVIEGKRPKKFKKNPFLSNRIADAVSKTTTLTSNKGQDADSFNPFLSNAVWRSIQESVREILGENRV